MNTILYHLTRTNIHSTVKPLFCKNLVTFQYHCFLCLQDRLQILLLKNIIAVMMKQDSKNKESKLAQQTKR
ncbi:TPA: hypothetical protein JBK16_07980 [Legionella pneumophila]|nr:hypothetical protein [Legionella pneumophila]